MLTTDPTTENSQSHSLLSSGKVERCPCGQGVDIRQYTFAYAEARLWKAHHARAVQREKIANQKCEQLKKEYKDEIGKITENYEKQIEELKALLKKRESQLFGKKTEKGTTKPDNSNISKPPKTKKRGGQPGSKGHGRRSNTNLSITVEQIDLAGNKKYCSTCHLPFKLITNNNKPDTEDSDILECHVKAHVRRIKRNRYSKTCHCPETPAIITPAAAPRLIPKGKIGISLWAHILLDKYEYYNPIYRLLRELDNNGLSLAQGTVTDGLKKITQLLQPLHQTISEYGRQLFHQQADETRWEVFEEKEGKVGTRWYLWLFLTKETKVYYVDPTRSSNVPKRYFKDKQEGILSVDRYIAYKAFVKGTHILLAFCWAHVRRDFLDVAKARGDAAEPWAMNWVDKINNLYHLNHQRLAYEKTSLAFKEADTTLRQAMDKIKNDYKKELQKEDDVLPPYQKKVLTRLKNHWSGLTIFVEHPEVPMDNNHSENGLRGPVLLRNSVKGAGSIWSSELIATMLTLFGTLKCWHINLHTWLIAFLTDCANAGGKLPIDWKNYLPWNMSEAERNDFKKPPQWDDTS